MYLSVLQRYYLSHSLILNLFGKLLIVVLFDRVVRLVITLAVGESLL